MERSQNSGKAIASLICGLVFFFWPLSAVAAVILGHLALSDILQRLPGRRLPHIAGKPRAGHKGLQPLGPGGRATRVTSACKKWLSLRLRTAT